jgi:glycosyltransferase involved in cell wall biosynthesis
MHKVLHFVTDYPGSESDSATYAVKNLLNATSDKIDHIVVMVDRNSKFNFSKVSNSSYRLCIPKFKFGLLNSTISFIAFIIFFIKFRELKKVHFIHCHKLTIDGLFGLYANLFYGIKYFISVRGATDEKWINKKIYARWLFKLTLKRAKHIFFVSAWMMPVISESFKIDIVDKSSLLPNLCNCEFLGNAKKIELSNKIIFVGRLSIWKSKRIDNIIKSISDLEHITLDLVGDYDNSIFEEISNFIKNNRVKAKINFLGKIDNKRIREILPDYAALVMPSYPETFGMAYIEALHEKVPVITSKRAGISGYLSGKPYIIPVDETNPVEIKNAIVNLIENQKVVKSELDLDYVILLGGLFSDEAIKKKYLESIK